MTKKWQQHLAIVFISMIVAFLFVGCFTVLRHPRVQTDVAEDTYECASCHADADLYHFRDPFHSYGYRDGYQSQGANPWYGYYVVPWWYDGYWYYPQGGEGNSHVRSGEERLWDRSSHPQQAPIPRVGSAPEGGAHAKPSAEDAKKEEKKDKKKRRLWGRGK